MTTLEHCERLIEEWFEASRPEFARKFPNLDYSDERYRPKLMNRLKYILLDEGTSGAFIVDKETGQCWRCKAYGVPNKKKPVGNVSTMTGVDLSAYRWF